MSSTNKPWFDQKVEVTREEYLEFTDPKVCECEFQRLEGPDFPPSLRMSNRETGKMVAGWDIRDGTYTYWIVVS